MNTKQKKEYRLAIRRVESFLHGIHDAFHMNLLHGKELQGYNQAEVDELWNAYIKHIIPIFHKHLRTLRYMEFEHGLDHWTDWRTEYGPDGKPWEVPFMRKEWEDKKEAVLN